MISKDKLLILIDTLEVRRKNWIEFVRDPSCPNVFKLDGYLKVKQLEREITDLEFELHSPQGDKKL